MIQRAMSFTSHLTARILVATFSALLLFLSSPSFSNSFASAQSYQVIRVADSISNPELGFFNTAIATPVIEGDWVIFRTLNSQGVVANIWSWNRITKQFTKLVDLSMAAPGGTGNFTDLNAGLGGPVLKDGIVVFGARDSGSPASPALPHGLYSVPVAGGAIQRIANYQTNVPGGVGTFFNFSGISAPTGNFSFSDGVVGFEGEFGGGPIGNSGIYQSSIAGDSQLPIADSLHGIGDIFPVTNFTHVQVHSNRAAFIGGTVFGYYALYSTNLPASLPNYNEVITVNAVLPGATGGFSFVLPSLRLWKDSIFFIARESASGGNNNRRTLYEIPFGGGAPAKIVSNFDMLPGLSTIELSSIESYDVNDTHMLIRAKAPGSTPEQFLYLYNRSSREFSPIFSLTQPILDRSFGLLAPVQPGAMTESSERIVVSLGGSALFIGPYTYIVMLSSDPSDAPVNSAALSALELLGQVSTALSEARKKLPPKPSKSLPVAKRRAINQKRASISAARKQLKELVTALRALEGASGDGVREEIAGFTAQSLRALNKQRTVGSSPRSSKKAARTAWKKFTDILSSLQPPP